LVLPSAAVARLSGLLKVYAEPGMTFHFGPVRYLTLPPSKPISVAT